MKRASLPLPKLFAAVHESLHGPERSPWLSPVLEL